MFVFHTACAAERPWRDARRSLKAPASLLVLCLLLGACAAPQIEIAAADPQANSTKLHYRPVLDGYQSARPVEPLSWRGRNDLVAPKEKGQ